MTREVRANLLFLVGLLILVTPGFFILMNKKLSGRPGKSNAMPDPVPYQIAYMQPLPAPPVPRREPPAVRQWVRELVAQRLGQATASAFDQLSVKGPIVSDHFVTQLLDLTFKDNGKMATLTLLRWDDRADPSAALPTIEADAATGQLVFGKPTFEAIDVPKDVRHALQDVGYVDPPPRVWWLNFSGSSTAETGAVNRLRLTVPNAKPPAVETFDFQVIKSDAAIAPSASTEVHH